MAIPANARVSNLKYLDLQESRFSLMFKKMLYLLACTLVNTTNAQVKPSTGSILNYRIIGFEVPQKKEAVTYVLQIAIDSVVSNDQLDRRHIIERVNHLQTE